LETNEIVLERNHDDTARWNVPSASGTVRADVMVPWRIPPRFTRLVLIVDGVFGGQDTQRADACCVVASPVRRVEMVCRDIDHLRDSSARASFQQWISNGE